MNDPLPEQDTPLMAIPVNVLQALEMEFKRVIGEAYNKHKLPAFVVIGIATTCLQEFTHFVITNVPGEVQPDPENTETMQ